MKTSPFRLSKSPRPGIAGIVAVCAGALLFTDSLQAQDSGQLQGIYKVSHSTDPLFPIRAQNEWFLDFGKGTLDGKFSGSVAVSLRQNPNVRVRIMAWQYFPNEGTIVIGNPFAEGSHQAVARGSWQMRPAAGGMAFERGTFKLVLKPADPADY